MRRKFLLSVVLLSLLFMAMGGGKLYAEGVAKVGNTEYATIDEAIAAWTNNTTLTLLSDVTLSDVVTIKSTEHHILNLGTYTMTAASGKNAFVIQACGNGSAERSTITINADANNPGGINAGSKCIIYYKYADGGISTEDRPIIKINGGVFTGSTSSSWGAGIYTIGTAARKCATLNITGGTFNCSIYGSGKSKLIVSGGVFNYSVGSQGDSTALRLISGGTFKTFGFMTADSNNTKFWFGTSMANSNVGVCVDDNGYIVVGGPVNTEAGDKFEASSENYSGADDLLQYSSAKDNGLYYTSVEEAFADNNKASGSVTVYVDELDMTGINYKGTIVVPENHTITITNAPETLVVKDENGNVLEPNANDSYTTIVPDYEGEGIQDNPYIIASIDDLSKFRDKVNGGETYEGVYFKLTEDITLTGEWTPIGNGSRSGNTYTGSSFKGTFDGGNYTISGLTITTGSSDETKGLFGVVDDGTVKNLKLTNVNISTSSKNVGAAAGLMVNNATIDNVEVSSGTLTAPDGVGGIVGRMIIDGTISNCTNKATVSATTAAGGIVGKAYYSALGREMNITVCTNEGNITGSYAAGGIAALSAANISGCSNIAVIASNEAGGIVGEQIMYGTINNNVNSGLIKNINNDGFAHGGIIGWVRYHESTTNYPLNGIINVTNNTNTANIEATGAAGGSGGIVGHIYNQANVTGNTNKAEHIYGGAFAAGIAGSLQQATGNLDIENTTITVSNNISLTSIENITVAGLCKDLFAYNNDAANFVVKDNSANPPVAQIGTTKYGTLEAAFAAATEGQTITLLADATPTLTSQRAITKAAVIDLGGKTLTLTEDDLYFGTTEFKNGNIIVDPSVKPSTAVFWMFANQTLTFDNVKLTATGVTGTYLIGLDGNNSDLNIINGSEIIIENTTALDLDVICVNASTGNDIVVEDSKVNVTNLDGRVFFRGNYTVKDSEVNLEGITKAGFRIEAGQTLSIEGTSVVNIVGEPRDGGIHLTDLTATYTVAETATVNATVNEPKVAKVGENTYRTFAEAAADAQAGDEIILLADIEGDITVPANVTLNGNGFAISGGIFAEGDITFAGVTTAADFDANVANTAVNIPAGASLQLTGSARLVIGHGATFNITGTIEDAKTADKATLVPSLKIAAGASITGNGVTFNVNNAYIVAEKYCSSKNSNANGTFNFNINNSIWDQTGNLQFSAPTNSMDPTVNFNLANSVLTTTGHVIFSVTKGEVVIDNSKVNEGVYRQLENRSTMTIKDGSVVNGAVATSENAKNPGTIIVENATYAVTGEFSGSDLGTGTIVYKKGATISAGSITKANIQIDATGMTIDYEINLTADLSKHAGALEVINNDNLDAKIIDGKIVLVEKPVAKIGETEYATLQAALNAAAQTEELTIIQLLAGTHTFGNVKFPATLKNVTIVGADNKATIIKDSKLYSADGNAVTYKGITFDGIVFDNSSILFTGARNGEVVYEDWTIKNCDFRNLQSTDGIAAIHFNLAADETIKNFTFENNTITDVTSPSNTASGLRLNYVTGNVVIKDNETNNVAFNAVQIINSVVDNFTFEGNILRSNGSSLANLYNVTGENIVIIKNQFLVANEDQKGVSNIAYADVSGNYWGGGAPINLPEGVVYSSYYTTVESDGTLGGLIELPQGNNFTGYTGVDAIWGEVWGNASESFVIKVLNANGENGDVMGTTSLNDIDGIIDGDVTVTWSLKLDAASNTDEYWTMNWTTAPSIDNMPAKVELWVDGVKVSGGNVVLNGPDNLNPIYAAVTDAEDKILSYHTSIAAAVAAAQQGNTIALLRNTDEEIKLPFGVTLNLNGFDAPNVTFTLPTAMIGETEYASVADALAAAQAANLADVVITIIGENTAATADNFNLVYKNKFDKVTFKQNNGGKVYYFNELYTGSRTNNGEFVFDGVNLVVTGQYMFEGNVKLSNNSFVKSTAEANCFVYNAEVTVEAGSKIDGVIEDIRGGSLIIDGGKTDGTYCSEPGLRDAILTVNWTSSNLVLKNGAYVKVNSANEVGRLTVNGEMRVTDSKLESYQWIQVNENATLTLNAGSDITTQEVNGAGNIIVDVTGLEGQATVIKGDMTGFTGTITVDRGFYTVTADGLVVERGLSGKGTEAEPYLITDADELHLFRQSVNAGETRYNTSDVWVVLNADIDLDVTRSASNWEPIGTFDYSFDGNFDGKGHIIKNLKIYDNTTAANGEAYLGFFGVTANNTIKNFVIENVTIESEGQIVAAAIAYPYYTEVSDITVKGDIKIKGGNYTAGVLAYTRLCQKASNLTVSGNEGSYIEGAQTVGGVIADIQMNHGLVANYSNFTAEGLTIKGTKSVGGISGIIAAQTLNVATVNNVTLNCEDDRVGIVSGALGGASTITNVTVENVTGATNIVGATYDGAKPIAAKIGDTYYGTLANALAADGEESVELLAPITIAVGETVVYNLNGKTVVATDNATGNYAMITNKGNLTIEGEGKLQLTATNNRGWSAYSSVISNTVGGKLTVNGGTIEHLGGTDMAYAIDNLTNGQGTYAETIINGGTMKSPYRAIRQFLNGIEAQNILTVNGGTIEGTNKSIWMQDPSAKANTGTLTVVEDATLKGDVYLSVTEGSTEWPVEVSIAAAALQGESTVMTNGNVPAGYELELSDGIYGVTYAVATIDDNRYETLQAAITAAGTAETTINVIANTTENITIQEGANITLEFDEDITLNGYFAPFRGNLTINGGTINNTNSGASAIEINDGELNLNNVNIASARHAVRIDGTVTATINGGEYTLTATSGTRHAVNVSGGAEVTIKAGTFVGPKGTTMDSGSAVCVQASSKVTIEGGDFSGGKNHTLSADGNLIVTGGTFDQDPSAYLAQGYITKYNETTSRYEVFKGVAKIENEYFASIQDAIDAAQNNDVITVISDFEMDITSGETNSSGHYVLTNVANKAVVIDLNGKKVTVDVTNLPEGCKDNMLMSVFCADTDGNLTLKDSSNGNGSVSVTGGESKTVYSLVIAYGGLVNIEGGNYSVDYMPAGRGMIYGNVSDHSGADGSNVSKGANISGGNFTLGNVGTLANGSPWILATAGSNTGKYIFVTGGTYNADILHQHWIFEVVAPTNKALKNNGNGTYTIVDAVAFVKHHEYSGYYSEIGYATLAEAFEIAETGDVVTLVTNVELENTITVNAGKDVILDLNGKVVSYESAVVGEDMITNKGKLTIESSVEGGKLTYKNTDETGANVTISTISTEPGSELIINGGIIENTSLANNTSKVLVPYTIDILTNGNLGDVTVTINGGSIISENYIAIRQFVNGNVCNNSLTVKGGSITAKKRAINVQDAQGGGQVKNCAKLHVEKGVITATEDGGYSICNFANSENISVIGGTFVGAVYSAVNGIISGGTFDAEPYYAYCAEGFAATNNDNGTWTVMPAQEQSLVAGWNWYSSYIDINGVQGLKKIENALGTNGIEILGHEGFTLYDSELGWYGPLVETGLDVKNMYKIEVGEGGVDMRIAGNIVDFTNETIEIKNGFNWISYPFNQPMNLNDALKDFTPAEGDYIVSHFSFAFYYDNQWQGSLESFTPGEGYIYERIDVDTELSYNVSNTRGAVKANVTTDGNKWMPNGRLYPNNMTMIAVVDGLANANYEVAAFVNGELRGSARPIYIESLDAYMLFLTIHGGDEVEEMSFRLYDIDNDTEYDLSDRINYSNNAHLGSVNEPYVFSRGTTGIGEASMSNVNIYPNPTTTGTEINLQATCDKVEVYNALGVKVAEYQNVDSIDALETAGIYVIRITNNGNVQNCRLVVK